MLSINKININDVRDFLTQNPIISQCIIKDYAIDEKTKVAKCSVIIPNTMLNNGTFTLLKDINCFIASPVDIVFKDYMNGLLLKITNNYATADEIANNKEKRVVTSNSMVQDALLAIILPNAETLPNITDALIKADYCYFGNKETNILDELVEYVKLMKDFFDQLAQNAPTIAAQPASGSAALQSAGQKMSQESQKLYDKLTKITKKQ